MELNNLLTNFLGTVGSKKRLGNKNRCKLNKLFPYATLGDFVVNIVHGKKKIYYYKFTKIKPKEWYYGIFDEMNGSEE